MKKILVLFLSLVLLLLLPACGKSAAAPETPQPAPAGDVPTPTASPDGGEVDVDLTKLSSTMVYSEVYAMMYEPEKYVGKTVKMQGQCAALTGSAGQVYYSCIVRDATACCAQGLEFELDDPEAYPETGEEITVVGTFDTYKEEYEGNYYLYIVLRDAELV